MFEKYPFEKLNEFLKDITPPKKLYNLTIGEPQFETPQIIQKALCDNSHLLKKYPKTRGEDELIEAQIDFIKKRYNIDIAKSQILPVNGTREVLFNFPNFLKPKKIAFPNPFYQIYEGSAINIGAKINMLNLVKENNFLPQISDLDDDVELVILNSPNNPTTSVMDMEELKKWVKLALERDFVIVSDECYSELYVDEKPPSILQASLEVGNSDFKNILAINSISKRSSAPGLRSGYIAGDEKILKDYLLYRTYVGCATSLPLQKAATVAWSDEEHVEIFREKYKKNLTLAKEILGEDIQNTFYVWLEVKDDLEFTKEAYKAGVKVMPGRFMGRNSIGEGYVRIALVYDEAEIKEALNIIKQLKEKL